MKNWKKIIPYVQTLKRENISLEDCIPLLKDKGISQVKTVYCLVKVYGISMSEADTLVLYSECWKEKSESTLDLRNAFWDAVENYGKYSEEE